MYFLRRTFLLQTARKLVGMKGNLGKVFLVEGKGVQHGMDSRSFIALLTPRKAGL